MFLCGLAHRDAFPGQLTITLLRSVNFFSLSVLECLAELLALSAKRQESK